VEFGELRLRLRAGDIVTFYTDGVTEARNGHGELFGAERLGETIAGHRDEQPETLITLVLAALHRFAGTERFEDDVTIVIMKNERVC